MAEDIKLTKEGDWLFIGGDLSGIQKFIYNITSKCAALSLTGRSQYLVDYISGRKASDFWDGDKKVHIEGLEGLVSKLRNCLPEQTGFQEVYTSGGKFYVIATDTIANRKAIDDFRKKEVRKLLNAQDGQLGLNIAYVPFKYGGNVDGKDVVRVEGESETKIGVLWKHINEQFGKVKFRKFQEVIFEPTEFEKLFTEERVSADVSVCAVTGIEKPTSELEKVKDDDDSDIMILKSVREQIDLGKRLRVNKHFRNFSEYAAKSYLGILRMDIDGLGKRFIDGFNTFSNYCGFSNGLDSFFKKLKEEVCTTPALYKHLNIVYAGGDDIFAVGHWDHLISFANYVRAKLHTEIKETLHEYLEGKDNITISGGIAIVRPKFPIAKAAELAGEAEEKAKSYLRAGETMPSKNAFCMFGEAFGWEDFEEIEKNKEIFCNLCKEQNVSKSILHRIMRYNEMAQEAETARKEGKKPDYQYIWHSAYALTRFRSQLKDSKNQEAIDFISKLQTVCTTPPKLRLAAIAARWAEQLLRTKN